MTTIDNGSIGPNRSASVNVYHQLETFSVTEPAERFANKRDGKTWSILSESLAVGPGDYIFYFKNTGNEPLEITEIAITSSAATTIYLDKVSGTPTHTAATTLIGVSRNPSKLKSITATIIQDTDTTGLNNDGTYHFQRCAVADTHYNMLSVSGVIIPNNTAVAIRTSAIATVEMLITISEVFE